VFYGDVETHPNYFFLPRDPYDCVVADIIIIIIYYFYLSQKQWSIATYKNTQTHKHTDMTL